MNRLQLFAAAMLLVLAGVALVLFTVSAMNRNAARQGSLSVQETGNAGPQTSHDDWLTNYRLTDQRGQPFESQKLAGQVHVVSFFFASCPGPCMKQNKKLAEICDEFGAHGVDFISITCDPETDTPSYLNQYAKKLQAGDGWSFLTGEMNYIKRVAAEVYSVPLDKGTHVESFLVIDKWGVRRGKFHWNSPAEIVALKKLLPELQAETIAPEPPKNPPPPADDEQDAHQKVDEEREIQTPQPNE